MTYPIWLEHRYKVSFTSGGTIGRPSSYQIGRDAECLLMCRKGLVISIPLREIVFVKKRSQSGRMKPALELRTEKNTILIRERRKSSVAILANWALDVDKPGLDESADSHG